MFFHFFLFFSSFDFFLANEYGEELDTGAIIDAFNKVRKDAYPPPSNMNQLQWDDGLAKAAQAAADACTFGEQLGQQAEKIFRTIAAPDGRRYMGYRLTLAGNQHNNYFVALWARIEKKHRLNSHPIIHFPTSEGVSEVSERANE